MNKILKTLRRHWTRVWLITMLLMSGGVFVTRAVYTEVLSVKRVVSTQASPGEMFSSNCMRPDISSRRLSSSEYSITVCNFDQDKPTVYNPSTISYTLHAELQIKQGDEYKNMAEYLETIKSNSELYNYYIGKADEYYIYKTEDDTAGAITITESHFTADNGFSVSLAPDTLAAQKSSVDKYKVKIDSDSISNPDMDIFVHVWADPTPPTTLRKIETRLYGATYTADTATWTGEFIEKNCETIDYDFYNYVITGSGKGTVDILWNPEKFQINQFFFDKTLSGNEFLNDNNNPSEILSNDAEYGNGSEYGNKYVGWQKVTLCVDSTTKNRYELQLYKTATEDSLTGVSYTGNDNAATKYIACYFNKEIKE